MKVGVAWARVVRRRDLVTLALVPLERWELALTGIGVLPFDVGIDDVAVVLQSRNNSLISFLVTTPSAESRLSPASLRHNVLLLNHSERKSLQVSKKCKVQPITRATHSRLRRLNSKLPWRKFKRSLQQLRRLLHLLKSLQLPLRLLLKLQLRQRQMLVMRTSQPLRSLLRLRLQKLRSLLLQLPRRQSTCKLRRLPRMQLRLLKR
jgi:hypothetical protein